MAYVQHDSGHFTAVVVDDDQVLIMDNGVTTSMSVPEFIDVALVATVLAILTAHRMALCSVAGCVRSQVHVWVRHPKEIVADVRCDHSYARVHMQAEMHISRLAQAASRSSGTCHFRLCDGNPDASADQNECDVLGGGWRLTPCPRAPWCPDVLVSHRCQAVVQLVRQRFYSQVAVRNARLGRSLRDISACALPLWSPHVVR